jgi:hypothetical protein
MLESIMAAQADNPRRCNRCPKTLTSGVFAGKRRPRGTCSGLDNRLDESPEVGKIALEQKGEEKP